MLAAAPNTPWLDAIRDMRTVQHETMREPASVAGRADPLLGIFRARHVDRDAYGVAVTDSYTRFSVYDTDATDLRNGDEMSIRGTTYTVVDITADAGLTHLRLERY